MEMERVDPEEFQLGVRVWLFNYNLDRELKRVCEEEGITLHELAHRMGMSYGTLATYKALSRYPPEEKKLKIAAYLGVPVDTLFPENLQNVRLERQPEPMGLTLQDALASGLVRDSAVEEDAFDRVGLREALMKGMRTLTEREREVLDKRFGLTTGIPRTLASVALDFGVGKGRIQQIEVKALRRLRYPSRQKHFKDYRQEKRRKGKGGK